MLGGPSSLLARGSSSSPRLGPRVTLSPSPSVRTLLPCLIPLLPTPPSIPLSLSSRPCFHARPACSCAHPHPQPSSHASASTSPLVLRQQQQHPVGHSPTTPACSQPSATGRIRQAPSLVTPNPLIRPIPTTSSHPRSISTSNRESLRRPPPRHRTTSTFPPRIHRRRRPRRRSRPRRHRTRPTSRRELTLPSFTKESSLPPPPHPLRLRPTRPPPLHRPTRPRHPKSKPSSQQRSARPPRQESQRRRTLARHPLRVRPRRRRRLQRRPWRSSGARMGWVGVESCTSSTIRWSCLSLARCCLLTTRVSRPFPFCELGCHYIGGLGCRVAGGNREPYRSLSAFI